MPILKLNRSPDQPGRAGLTLGRFAARQLIIVIIAALAAALWQLSDILVPLFGAVLLAIGLCTATRLLPQHTGIRRSFALAGVFMLGLCIFGAALWVVGSTVGQSRQRTQRDIGF